MKAVVIHQYGGPEVLHFEEMPKPSPKPGEVLVRVRAASVNPIDWQIRSGALKYVMRKSFPLVLGVDFAGEVAEAPPGSGFAVGDAVMASMHGDTGAFAEFVVAPENIVARKPTNMSFEEAASVPATSMTALQALRDHAHVREGQTVLVNGASGGVGLFAVQLARALGAASVTAVCGARSFDMVKGLGADTLVDYRTTDFTKQRTHYDVIIDTVSQGSFAGARAVLQKPGVYVTTSPKSWFGAFARQALINPFVAQKACVFMLKTNAKDLAFVASLIEDGRVRTVIDKVYPVDAVADAQQYSASGRAQGKLVLKFPD